MPNSSEVFLSGRERQLLHFTRQLGWGEVRIRIENGQPVLIYEAIKTLKLDDTNTGRGARKRTASQGF
jgi:hypothetical protein